MLTVATIGLSQLLIVASQLSRNIWGQTPIGTAAMHVPVHLSLRLSPVVFTADDLVAVLVSVLSVGRGGPLVQVAPTSVSPPGLRGDRRDRAAMLGIPVNRLQTVTGVVAGVLSISSVFLKAAIVGLPLYPTFSLTALVSTLWRPGPRRVHRSAVGGAGRGSGRHLRTGRGLGPTRPPHPGGGGDRRGGVVWHVLPPARPVVPAGTGSAGGQWVFASGIRDIPAAWRRLVEVRLGASGGAVLLLGFMATLPLWLGPGSLLEVSTLLALAVVGCSLVVLTGWAGQVSLGQMSFAAAGGVAVPRPW